uniref:NADH dehydrogenase subunit 2 n=1 Tax=Pegea confoederata TaxID=942563 RepID=A0AA86IXE1_9UROC|nr:NADH dehydrogenase subunit 2 [Pegea confoederata]
MMQFLKCFMMALLIVTSFVDSYLGLWIMGEILGLASMYYVLESYKPFCRLTMMQFIFTMFQFSLLMLIGLLLNMYPLLLVGVMGKLGVMPFHSPMFAFGDLLKTHSFTYVFILPKVPYYLMGGLGVKFLVIPVLMTLVMGLSFSLKENLIMSLTISSALMLILFNHNSVLGMINLFMLIIWGLFLTSGKDYSNGGDNSTLGFLTLSTILPLPGSYSMIMKYYLSSFPSLAYLDVVCLVLVGNFSLLFMVKYVSGFSKFTGSGLVANGYAMKPWNMYTLGVYLVSLLLILWL